MLSITAGYYKQFKTKQKKRWERAGERGKGEKGERRKEKQRKKIYLFLVYSSVKCVDEFGDDREVHWPPIDEEVLPICRAPS